MPMQGERNFYCHILTYMKSTFTFFQNILWECLMLFSSQNDFEVFLKFKKKNMVIPTVFFLSRYLETYKPPSNSK